jgi:uncharacterized protein YlaN (UPF0358 family)
MKIKFISFLFFFVFVLLSCKKYKEDGFISTYSPKDRIKNTESNIWSLSKYFDLNGDEKNVDAHNFKLWFIDDSLHISSLNQEFKSSYKWSLVSDKKYLSINDNLKFEILQLEVNKLKLKNDKGQIYYFDKIKLNDTIKVCDETVLNTPLFGMQNELSKSIKLVDVNHCEQNNISVFKNGSQLSSPIDVGLFGNGIGYNGYSSSELITFSFSKSFSNEGFITFYDNWVGNPTFKIDNVSVPYDYVKKIKNTPWSLIRVKVSTPGYHNFILTKQYGSIIDEIKFWEFE